MRNLLRSLIYPLEVNLNEQFSYGMREVLLSTHGLDPSSLINAKLVHGDVDYKSPTSWPSIWRNPLIRYPILCWSKIQEKELKRLGFRETIVPIGSPYIHLIDYIKKAQNLRFPQYQKNSLLYFPNHSHPGFQVKLHNTKDLKECFDGFDQVTICLFWLDFIDLEIRNRYLELGVDVTCVGYKGPSNAEKPWSDNGGRVNHLLNLAYLISRHEFILTDSPTITLMYAISLHKSVKFLKYEIVGSSFHNSSKVEEELVSDQIEPQGIVQSLALANRLSPDVWYHCGEENLLLRVADEVLGKDSMIGFQDWVSGSNNCLTIGKVSSRYVESFQSSLTNLFGC